MPFSKWISLSDTISNNISNSSGCSVLLLETKLSRGDEKNLKSEPILLVVKFT